MFDLAEIFLRVNVGLDVRLICCSLLFRVRCCCCRFGFGIVAFCKADQKTKTKCALERTCVRGVGTGKSIHFLLSSACCFGVRFR